MQFSLIPFISSFALTVIFLPLFIGFMRMKHEGQVIRDEGPNGMRKNPVLQLWVELSSCLPVLFLPYGY